MGVFRVGDFWRGRVNNLRKEGFPITLTDEQAAMLGATQEFLYGITFRDPVYTLANADMWNELVNRLKA